MQNIELILSMLVTIVGFIILTITFLSKYIKNAKAKKKLSSVVKLSEAIIPYIEEAEKFTGYTGKEKKTYVITRLKEYALNNNMKFDNDDISEKLEELIELSKLVNNNKSVSSKTSDNKENSKGEMIW